MELHACCEPGSLLGTAASGAMKARFLPHGAHVRHSGVGHAEEAAIQQENFHMILCFGSLNREK